MENPYRSYLEVLNKIWSKYRGERLSFPTDDLETLSFKKNYSVSMTKQMSRDPRNGKERMVYVLFVPLKQTLHTELTSILVTAAEERNYEHVVLVCSSTTKNTKSSLQKSMTIIWEVLSYDDLKFCAPCNVLVPIKYELLTDKERAEFTTDPSKLRKMFARDNGQVKHHVKQDVMARLLGFRMGDIVRITEAHTSTGLSISHRLLV